MRTIFSLTLLAASALCYGAAPTPPCLQNEASKLRTNLTASPPEQQQGRASMSQQTSAEEEELYSQTFDTPESINDITIINNNNDDETWQWINGELRYSFASDAADDYVVLPGISLEAGKKYKLSFDTHTNGTSFPEKIAAYVGTGPTPEALTTCLVEPTTLKNGNPITLSGEFIPQEAGTYYFAVKACSDAMEYYLFVDNIKVTLSTSAPVELEEYYSQTFDTSESVNDVTITDNNTDGVTWTWLDGALRYKFTSKAADDYVITPAISLEGGKTYRFSFDTWTSGTTFPEKIAAYAGTSPTPEALTTCLVEPTTLKNGSPITLSGEFIPEEGGTYYFAVKACSDAMQYYLYVDNLKIEKVVNIGPETVPLPYSQNFDSEKCLEEVTIVDANYDSNTWFLDNGTMAYNFSTREDADDYIILPPFDLQKEQSYKITLKAWNKSEDFLERIAIVAGKEPASASLTTTVLQPTDISSPTPTEISGYLVPDSDGAWYVAVKACSPAKAYTLFIDDITVDAPTEASIPAAVTNLTVAADATGALKATISFTAPDKDIAGRTLASLDKVEIKRGNEVIATLTPERGAPVSYTDTQATYGLTTYTVTGINSAGSGASVKAGAFIGYDLPLPTEKVMVSHTDTDGVIKLEWDAVTQDVNGKPLPAGKVKYAIAEIASDGTQSVLVVDVETTAGLLTVSDGTEEQRFVSYAVFARNEIGYGNGTSSGRIAVGRPYDLPFHEGFAQELKVYPDRADNAYWFLTDNEADLEMPDVDNAAVMFHIEEDNIFTRLHLGIINLADATDPVLSFWYYNRTEEDRNLMRALIDAGEGDIPLCEPFRTGSGNEACWERYEISLREYIGKKVQISLEATRVNVPRGAIDNILVVEKRQNDLSCLSLDVPPTGRPGESVQMTATVANYALSPADGYKVILRRDGQAVGRTEGTPLPSGAKAGFVFDVEIPRNEIDNHLYTAEVEYDGDEYAVNDISEEEILITAVAPHPRPEALTAAMNENGVTINWQAPSPERYPVVPETDDFEAYDSFATGNAGGWTFIDHDHAPVGGFFNVTVPNVPSGSMASFFIFDSAGEGFNETFQTASGTKCLASLYNQNSAANNDWAVSPLLAGHPQFASFKSRSYSVQSLETLEVLASEGGIEPSDFIKVARFPDIPATWTDYTVYLPEGTRRVAFVNVSHDKLMVMVDDVSLCLEGAETEAYTLTGYNIYRDGEMINSSPVAEQTYTDPEGSTASRYQVSAIYAIQGESAPTQPVTPAISAVGTIPYTTPVIRGGDGEILVQNTEGMKITVADTAGRIIASMQAATNNVTLPVSPGIYIVSAGTAKAKATVR